MENWKFVDAKFVDANRETIQIIWEDNDQEVEEIIPADETNHRYQELLKHTTLDDLHFNTHEWIKEQKRMYRAAVKHIAAEDGLIFDSKDIQKLGMNYALSNVEPETDTDKERLFKLKLELFENDFVKSSQNKELKSTLRKSTSPIDALQAAIDIVKDNS